MSSETGDIGKADDKSGRKTNNDPEPMVVDDDVATTGNESKQADDALTSATTESEVKEKLEKAGAEVVEEPQDLGEEAKVAKSVSVKETVVEAVVGKKTEVGDNTVDTEPEEEISVDTESPEDKTAEVAKNTEESSDLQSETYEDAVGSQGTETEIDSQSDGSVSPNIDTYYNTQDIDYDSDSDKELSALKEMGNSDSRSKRNGKKTGASPYQNSSSDEYEESWGRPWRSKKQRTKAKKPFSFTRRWSEKDTEEYRKGYPGKRDNPTQRVNLDFYLNRTQSRPDGDFIDNIHKHWKGDYHRLEVHHGYIQWLFPIRENGMNFHAKELQLHEAKGICDNRIAHKRVLRSYKMMLDFYGMKLKNDETGEVERADNWEERFHHLNRSMHNYLRITRILKSLGELGYEHLKAPFVRFVLEEALKEKTLDRTVNSCYNYWLETIKDDQTREELKDYAHELMSDND